jgi:hypothetical protein
LGLRLEWVVVVGCATRHTDRVGASVAIVGKDDDLSAKRGGDLAPPPAPACMRAWARLAAPGHAGSGTDLAAGRAKVDGAHDGRGAAEVVGVAQHLHQVERAVEHEDTLGRAVRHVGGAEVPPDGKDARAAVGPAHLALHPRRKRPTSARPDPADAVECGRWLDAWFIQ